MATKTKKAAITKFGTLWSKTNYQKINAKKITVLFDQGILHHQQGQLSEAKLVYQNIIELDQRNFDAIHMLGVISYQEHYYKE
jgi:Flp pilus assembly protein TadD